MIQIDSSTDFGKRVEQRLEEEIIVWLTTVRPDGQPVPVPVWFFWDGETMLIYSRPDTPKLRNIRQQPNVSLNFDSDGNGGSIVQFDGEARIDDATPPATDVPAFIDKYREGISNIGTTPEGFAGSFSVPIRVTLTNLRGH